MHPEVTLKEFMFDEVMVIRSPGLVKGGESLHPWSRANGMPLLKRHTKGLMKGKIKGMMMLEPPQA